MTRIARSVIAIIACLYGIAAVSAEPYPSKSLLVILPMQSASASDVMVRLVAQKMAENMRQQIVIVNLPGAAGLIGTERIANALPDGYTIGGINDGLLTQIPYLYAKVPYDPVKSFEPVSMVAAVSYVLIAHPAAPSTLKEIVAAAKASPGKIDFASGGASNAQHIAMELFMRATGTSLNHVPYRGVTQATLDVVGGRIPLMFAGIAPNIGTIKEGRLRAVAVPSAKRSPLLPDAPTFAEAGVPGFTFFTWTALSKMHAGLKRNFQLMPGTEWLALLCQHIPDRYEHLGALRGVVLEPRAGRAREEGFAPSRGRFSSVGRTTIP